MADDITQEVVGVDQLRPAAAYLAGVDVAEGLRARGLDHTGVQAMSMAVLDLLGEKRNGKGSADDR